MCVCRPAHGKCCGGLCHGPGQECGQCPSVRQEEWRGRQQEQWWKWQGSWPVLWAEVLTVTVAVWNASQLGFSHTPVEYMMLALSLTPVMYVMLVFSHTPVEYMMLAFSLTPAVYVMLVFSHTPVEYMMLAFSLTPVVYVMLVFSLTPVENMMLVFSLTPGAVTVNQA